MNPSEKAIKVICIHPEGYPNDTMPSRRRFQFLRVYFADIAMPVSSRVLPVRVPVRVWYFDYSINFWDYWWVSASKFESHFKVLEEENEINSK